MKKRNFSITFLVLLVVVLTAMPALAGKPGDPPPKHEIRVSQYGDGDFTTIMEAMAAIPDNTGGYRILVGPGAYNETVTVKPGVQLVGAGIGATRITGGPYAINMSSGGLVRDMEIYGTMGGIYATHGSNEKLFIYNVLIWPGSGGHGIYAYGSGDMVEIRDSWIHANSFTIEDAIHVVNTNASGRAIIAGVSIYGGGQTGIYVLSDRVSIENCHVDWQGKNGIYAIGGGGSPIGFSIHNCLVDFFAYPDGIGTGIYAGSSPGGGTISDVQLAIFEWPGTIGIEGGINPLLIKDSLIKIKPSGNGYDGLAVKGYNVEIINSKIDQVTTAVEVPTVGGPATNFSIASSMIGGAIIDPTGIVKIVNSYDGNYLPIPNQ